MREKSFQSWYGLGHAMRTICCIIGVINENCWKCWCNASKVGVTPVTASIIHSPTMTVLTELSPTIVTEDVEEQAGSTESTQNGTFVGLRGIVPP